MKKFKSYKLIIYSLLFSVIYSQNNYYFYYSLNQGANLLSFPIVNDNNLINDFFDSNNPNLMANDNLQSNIISVITEGEIGININNEWQGSLDQILTEKGYWLILNQPSTFLHIGSNINDTNYFLHPGSNLISFPYHSELHINDALPIYATDVLLAIIGQNESLLIQNNQTYGSLTHFKPGNGYWFIANDHTIFSYDIDENRSSQNYKNIKNDVRGFNQSINQSIYFTENIYFSGQQNIETLSLNIYCNNKLVGNKDWTGQYSDLIAMGSDGYEWTHEYCEVDDPVTIKNNSQELFVIKGDETWSANNYNIIVLSDVKSGDINFDHIINIADIVIMVNHIIDTNILNNDHKKILADINQDEIINVADLIINIETIIND